MPIVLKSLGTARGDMRKAGQYLEAFDFEAHNGQGLIDMTPDVRKAMRFENVSYAMAFLMTQPKCKPFRDYGDNGPNRPLTATTWEFVTISGGSQ
jgi:hypothetical protein